MIVPQKSCRALCDAERMTLGEIGHRLGTKAGSRHLAKGPRVGPQWVKRRHRPLRLLAAKNTAERMTRSCQNRTFEVNAPLQAWYARAAQSGPERTLQISFA